MKSNILNDADKIMYDHLQIQRKHKIQPFKWILNKYHLYWHAIRTLECFKIVNLIWWIVTYLQKPLESTMTNNGIDTSFIPPPWLKPWMNVEILEWTIQVYPVVWLPWDTRASLLLYHLNVILRSVRHFESGHRWSLNSLSVLISVSF